LKGLDWCTGLSRVDLRPERFSIGVQAWLVGIDSLPAVFLMVALLSAEDACHLVAVRVVAGVIVPPLLLIISVTVVLWSENLASFLTSILLRLGVEFFLTILRDCFNVVISFFPLDSLDFGGTLGLIL